MHNWLFRNIYSETVFFESPCSNLVYKSNNTTKFLIVKAPNGYIMASRTYIVVGQVTSTKKHSGFLNYLFTGDEVRVDFGLMLERTSTGGEWSFIYLLLCKAEHSYQNKIPLNQDCNSAERIHVEKAIMRMKSFKILNIKYCIRSIGSANKTLCVIVAFCNTFFSSTGRRPLGLLSRPCVRRASVRP